MDTLYIKDILIALKIELIRYRVACVVLFILVSTAILFIGSQWPKSYTTSTALYADETNILGSLLEGQASVTPIDRSDQAREIIYTRRIMEAVARKVGLLDADANADQVERVIRTIRSKVTLKSEGSKQFRISYVASDPDLSFELVSHLASLFIEDTVRKKREESLGAYNFIDAQVQSYQRQLQDAEQKLKEFKAGNLDGNEATVMSRIAQLRTEIESLRITIDETQSRVNTLQQQLNSEGQYQQTKGQVDVLRQRRQNLYTQLEQLLLSYQENYPDVISLRAQIAELDATINDVKQEGDVYTSSDKVANPLYEELRKQLSVAEVELRAQTRRMQSLVHLQEQEYERAQRVAANQAELSELTRDQSVIQQKYEEMRQSKESARLSMTLDIEGQGVSYRIQEPATFPIHPSGLTFKHFVVLGPILGVLIPFGLLLFYVMFDPHIRSTRILQQQLPNIEILGAVPHYNSPLGERLLRKDIVVLIILCVLFMSTYVAFAIYWYNNHN